MAAPRPGTLTVGELARTVGLTTRALRHYAILGRAEPALYHARRCVELTEAPEVDEWVAASAQEALARAYAVDGDLERARDARHAGLALARDIADPEDRDIVLADLDTLPLD